MSNADPTESAGVASPGLSLRPESKGGFRERSAITVRHVEIARKLAVSETFEALEEMRHRIEALMLLDDTTRRYHKINDDDLSKALQIYGIVTAFQHKTEIPNGGFKFIMVPFPQTETVEQEKAFEEWLDKKISYSTIMDNKDRMTEETAALLESKFITRAMPWVLRLTARVSDAIQLDEFDAAAGKITLKRGVE
jgi:hypothetical protein